MKLVITGVPGTGKSTLSKALAKKLKLRLVSEREFVNKHKIGEKIGSVFEVDLRELKLKLSNLLKKEKNILLEGHLLAEIKLKIDLAVLLKLDPQKLEKRLKERDYPLLKIWDNVFIEENNLLEKSARKSYGSNLVVLDTTGKSIKNCITIIIQLLSRRKLC